MISSGIISQSVQNILIWCVTERNLLEKVFEANDETSPNKNNQFRHNFRLMYINSFILFLMAFGCMYECFLGRLQAYFAVILSYQFSYFYANHVFPMYVLIPVLDETKVQTLAKHTV